MRSERAATPRPRLASPPFPPPSPQTAFGAANAEYVAAYKALQAKYHTVYSDLWRKRADIVSGAAGAAPADGAATASKGIEGFWLQALQNGRRTGATIEEHDEPVLKFLTDVRLAYLDDFTGFRLEFVFAPNPYFTNAQLDKTFHIPFMMGGGRLGSDPTIEKIVGCEINWLPGKNVTEKEVKKSQKKKGKKMTIVKKVGERRARRGGEGTRAPCLTGDESTTPRRFTPRLFFFTAFSTFRAALQEPVESFFRFFGTPNMDEDADEDMEPEEVYELNEQIQMEMDVGFEIKNKIVPRAVEWFTGEAVEDDSDDEDDDEDDEDDEGDEEDEDDEEDEEEDEECVARAHARARAQRAHRRCSCSHSRASLCSARARVCRDEPPAKKGGKKGKKGKKGGEDEEAMAAALADAFKKSLALKQGKKSDAAGGGGAGGGGGGDSGAPKGDGASGGDQPECKQQ